MLPSGHHNFSFVNFASPSRQQLDWCLTKHDLYYEQQAMESLRSPEGELTMKIRHVLCGDICCQSVDGSGNKEYEGRDGMEWKLDCDQVSTIERREKALSSKAVTIDRILMLTRLGIKVSKAINIRLFPCYLFKACEALEFMLLSRDVASLLTLEANGGDVVDPIHVDADF
jgi:hypothetical protein